MADLKIAHRRAQELLAQYGLADWRVIWNSNRSRNGYCQRSTRTIALSKFTNIHRTDAEVEQTIIHEIAHALTPGHNHDRVWLAKARSMGYTGGRRSDSTADATAAMAAASRYVGTCERCAQKFPKHRMDERKVGLALWKHPKCGGKIAFQVNTPALTR